MMKIKLHEIIDVFFVCIVVVVEGRRYGCGKTMSIVWCRFVSVDGKNSLLGRTCFKCQWNQDLVLISRVRIPSGVTLFCGRKN